MLLTTASFLMLPATASSWGDADPTACSWRTRTMSDDEEDTCMSFEEEDTCMSYEEEDASMSYEEEDACTSYEEVTGGYMHVK